MAKYIKKKLRSALDGDTELNPQIPAVAKKLVEKEKESTIGTIITYNGKTELRSACRSINNKFYKIGNVTIKDSGDCYLMTDGQYYRLAQGKIAWNFSTNVYDYVENMVKGYIPNKEKIGYFNYDVKQNFNAVDNLLVFDDKTIEMHKLHYDFTRGVFLETANGRNVPMQIREKPSYKTLPNTIYGMGDYPKEILDDVTKSYKETLSNTPKSIFDKYFEGLKFGLEIETDLGWWPEPYYYKFGCVPLKDGSIHGTEITTIPYEGRFNLFADLFKSMCKYTQATQNNSLHVNISGFKNTPEFRVAIYNMYYRLQQEINAFTPVYKRELAYFINKPGGAKDHCQPLEKLGVVFRYDEDEYSLQIEKSDIEIFKFLNEGHYNERCNIKSRRHIKEGGHKWDQHNRYRALNMIPLYFGNVAASRIEYRVHSGTVNPTKSLVWLFITSAITKFVENNAKRILCSKEKITLDDILKETYEDETKEGLFLLEYIRSYIAQREITNTRIVTTHGDIYGNEFLEDRQFAFKLNNKSDLFTVNESAGKGA